MLYDAYEAKMQRIAVVLDKIRKYRVLILCCTAFILAAVGAFIGFKGTLLADAVAPTEPITYGDTVEFKGKALFGKTGAQYRIADGGEWQDGFPIFPGEYVVRAVSRRSFGIKQYGVEQTLTVLKRPISVGLSDTAVYGEAPEHVSEGLAHGDVIQTVSVKYDAPYEAVSRAEIEAVCIINGSGDDVTEGYDITLSGADVAFEHRPITVKFESAEKIYDGLPLQAEGMTAIVGSTAYGDVISCSSYPSVTDAVEGGIENRPGGLKIVNDEGRDVTHFYAVTADIGRLTVLKREITVRSNSAEKIYDGSPFYDLRAEITSGELVSGHIIEYEYVNERVAEVGSFLNAVNLRITDGGGKDVGRNYKIKKDDGTLKIEPRPITVTGSSRTWIFDGLVHAADTLSPRFTVSLSTGDSGLVVGHAIECRTGATALTVGETENAVTDVIIRDAMERDVTANYKIIAVSGKLTVLKRAITVTVKSTEYVYTGEERSYPRDFMGDYFTLTLGKQAALPDGMPLDTAFVEITDPLGAANIEIGCEFSGSISRVGTVTVTPAVIGILQNNSVVNDCYDITVINGSITVNPRRIALTPEKIFGTYNGGTVKIDGVETEASYEDAEAQEGKLVVKLKPVVKVSASGDVAGEYLSSIDSFTVFDADTGEDITDCFAVTKRNGVFVVQKRHIKIIFSSGTWVYDGLPHSITGFGAYTVVSLVDNDPTPLCEGHTLSFRTRGVITDVGEVIHTMDGRPLILDANGRDVTSNYEIPLHDGVLTVTPRPITVLSGSAEKIYDGTPLSDGSYRIVSGSLVNGHTLDVKISGSRTNAGESENLIDTVTVWDGSRDVTFNYLVETETGVLTVTKRPVKMGITATDFTYDGVAYGAMDVCTAYEIGESGFYGIVDGHRVGFSAIFRSDRVTSQNSVRLVGDYTVTVDSYTVTDAEGRDLTDNYDIVWTEGYLSVAKRKITVIAISYKFKYDGNEHYAKELSPDYEMILDNDPSLKAIGADDYPQVTVLGSITYPGTAVSHVESVRIQTDRGDDVTFCYEITTKDGTLTMLPSEITVISGSASKVYDGTPLIAHVHTLVGALYPGDRIVCEFTGSQTEIGVSANYFTYTVLNSEGEDVTASYETYWVLGSLDVTEDGYVEPPVSGDIGGAVGNEKPDPSGVDGKTVFSYITGSAGRLYFRENHFGDYDPLYGWRSAPEGEDKYGYTMIAEALRGNKLKESVVIFPSGTGSYLSTYYADKNTVGEGWIDRSYTVEFYRYDWRGKAVNYTGAMSEYEAAMRDYAYENYTDLPEETRVAMYRLITDAAKSAGVNLERMSRKERVAWICSYVQNAAVYDLNFPDFPEDVDKAIYFLTVAKRGVCRHFATSAVVAYRALGIPARYVVGYASSAVSGERIEVTGMNAHAWVEVYIDGTGWVYVDPTGSYGGNGGDGGEGGETPDEPPSVSGKIVIVPYEIRKVYNGQAVTCGNDQFWIKSGKELLPDGYRIEVTVEGSQTKVGRGESRITKVRIYDANDNEITEQYDIVPEKGVIEVMPIKIIVYTASASKEYDGRRLSAQECYVSMGKLLSGHTLEATGYNYIVNIGSEANTVEKVTVCDKDGNDVTDCYQIEIIPGILTVTGG